jgi:hypothetical protein
MNFNTTIALAVLFFTTTIAAETYLVSVFPADSRAVPAWEEDRALCKSGTNYGNGLDYVPFSGEPDTCMQTDYITASRDIMYAKLESIVDSSDFNFFYGCKQGCNTCYPIPALLNLEGGCVRSRTNQNSTFAFGVFDALLASAESASGPSFAAPGVLAISLLIFIIL